MSTETEVPTPVRKARFSFGRILFGVLAGVAILAIGWFSYVQYEEYPVSSRANHALEEMRRAFKEKRPLSHDAVRTLMGTEPVYDTGSEEEYRFESPRCRYRIQVKYLPEPRRVIAAGMFTEQKP
jgi:hypothetical protein